MVPSYRVTLQPVVSSANTGFRPKERDTARRSFAAFLSDEDMPVGVLSELNQDGMAGFRRRRARDLKLRLLGDSLAARGLTEAQLTALPEAQRLAIEDAVMAEVEARLVDALAAEDRDRRRNAAGTGALMSGSTLDGLLLAAQER